MSYNDINQNKPDDFNPTDVLDADYDDSDDGYMNPRSNQPSRSMHIYDSSQQIYPASDYENLYGEHQQSLG